MSDVRVRDLEMQLRRSRDVESEVAWLAERLRAGEVSREAVLVAALLGHSAAAAAVGDSGEGLPDDDALIDELAAVLGTKASMHRSRGRSPLADMIEEIAADVRARRAPGHALWAWCEGLCRRAPGDWSNLVRLKLASLGAGAATEAGLRGEVRDAARRAIEATDAVLVAPDMDAMRAAITAAKAAIARVHGDRSGENIFDTGRVTLEDTVAGMLSSCLSKQSGWSHWATVHARSRAAFPDRAGDYLTDGDLRERLRGGLTAFVLTRSS